MGDMAQPKRVMIHTKVELELFTESGEREPLVVQLAEGRSANLAEGWMDIDAPLGRAIRGQVVGARVPYRMGDIVAVRIVQVSPVDVPTDDAEARRQQILEEARRKSEQTTQEIFSSTYGSKWGAYHAEELADSPSRPDDNAAGTE